MFFYEGQSCPVCKQHFAETDDIVVCPECGAPHHRACWKSEGHCHFEANHGTEQQWAKQPPVQEVPKRRCPHCGADNPEFAEFCGYCGRDIEAEPPARQFTPHSGFSSSPFPFPDPFGGVSRTETIDGISVETIARVIGPNAAYYLPRFKTMSQTGRKVFWNFPALLIPYNWLLYRKNLLIGWLIFAFYWIVNSFFQLAFDRLFPGDTLPTGAEFAQLLLTGDNSLLWIVMYIALAVIVAIHVLCGLFGNWIYMQQVLKKARRLQEDPQSYDDQQFLGTGGVSPAMGILPELITTFLNIISMF